MLSAAQVILTATWDIARTPSLSSVPHPQIYVFKSLCPKIDPPYSRNKTSSWCGLTILAAYDRYPADSTMADQWCVTYAKTDELSFRWTITNFDVTTDEAGAKPLESPQFTCRIPNIEWYLRLRHGSVSSSENLSLSIVQLTTAYSRGGHNQGIPLRGKVEFSLLNKNGQKEYSKESQMQELGAKKEVGFSDFIDKKTLLERKADLLYDNCLKVLCELTVKGTIAHTPVQCIEDYLYPDPANSLGAQLGVVLDGPDEGLYSDFTINAGERRFKVHKLLLATRSPVFRAMIDSAMKEGSSSCVNIEDHSPEVVKEMLTYVYTGQAPNVKKLVEDLLSIAHKYQLDSLVLMCGKELRNRLTPGSAVLTLRQAEKYAIKPLKTACLKYALGNFKQVEKSAAFSALKTEEPELYLELLEAKTLSTVVALPVKRARNRHPGGISSGY